MKAICIDADIFCNQTTSFTHLSKILILGLRKTSINVLEDKTNDSMWPASNGHVYYLLCIVENERGCKFITANSKVQGSFRVFYRRREILYKHVCQMPLEIWSAVKYNTNLKTNGQYNWNGIQASSLNIMDQYQHRLNIQKYVTWT